ncbi:MAG: gamma-glutamyltransferase [Alphaproteobacteria bacterium]
MRRWLTAAIVSLALGGSASAAERQMVVAAHPLAADAGIEVLRDGGNAIDAMVAIQAVLGLVEPQSSGLGGGAFLVYFDAESGDLTTFDGRETAPLAAGSDYFLGMDGEPVPFWDALVGGRSVGVPGTPKLLDVVHARYGTQDWAGLLAPAITLAEEGFAVTPRLAEAVADARAIDRFAPTRDYFMPGGEPLEAGDTLTNPAYAAALRRLQQARSQPFYDGGIAEAIIATTAAAGGVLTLDDFQSYEVVERDPVCARYRGLDVCGMGPPSSGGLTVGQILGMLEHADMAALGYGAEAAHLIAEASRLAFADRAVYMADGDYVDVPSAGLLDPGYLTVRTQLIDRDAANPEAAAGFPPRRGRPDLAPQDQPEPPGTSHFVVVDAMGNALSMTTTIESGFGSRLMTNGFLLNNELTDFSFRPEVDGRPVANRVEGGKRPRSSMSPTIVMRDGRPYVLTGSPGGSRIIGYTAMSLLGMLDWGLEPQPAVELGHIVNQGGTTDLEEGTAAASFAAELRARGHEVEIGALTSGLHALMVDDGVLLGGADPRREGVVRAD